MKKTTYVLNILLSLTIGIGIGITLTQDTQKTSNEVKTQKVQSLTESEILTKEIDKNLKEMSILIDTIQVDTKEVIKQLNNKK